MRALLASLLLVSGAAGSPCLGPQAMLTSASHLVSTLELEFSTLKHKLREARQAKEARAREVVMCELNVTGTAIANLGAGDSTARPELTERDSGGGADSETASAHPVRFSASGGGGGMVGSHGARRRSDPSKSSAAAAPRAIDAAQRYAVQCRPANSSVDKAQSCNCLGLPPPPTLATRPVIKILTPDKAWLAGALDAYILKILIEEHLGYPAQLVSWDVLTNTPGGDGVFGALERGEAHLYPEVSIASLSTRCTVLLLCGPLRCD